MASSYDGMLPRRFRHWMDYRVGNGPHWMVMMSTVPTPPYSTVPPS